MLNLYDELRALVDAFEGAAVDYALCGALALAVHGVARATKDIDVLARTEDAERVRNVARAAGFTLEALPMTFRSGISLRRFSKIVDGRPLMLDVLLVDEALEQIWRSREVHTWKHGPIHVVSREGLITLKLTAGRPQDLVDIQSLTQLEQGDD